MHIFCFPMVEVSWFRCYSLGSSHTKWLPVIPITIYLILLEALHCTFSVALTNTKPSGPFNDTSCDAFPAPLVSLFLQVCLPEGCISSPLHNMATLTFLLLLVKSKRFHVSSSHSSGELIPSSRILCQIVKFCVLGIISI